jgi:hypothetical protein
MLGTTPADTSQDRRKGADERNDTHRRRPARGRRYEIRLKGHLDGRWAAWFDGLSLSHESEGLTVIRGHVPDQAALHGLLQKVRDTGLPLVSVTHVDADPTGTPSTEPR